MLRTFNMHVEMCNTMFGIDTSRTHDRMCPGRQDVLITNITHTHKVSEMSCAGELSYKFSWSLLCACATNHCDYFQEQKERGGGTVM